MNGCNKRIRLSSSRIVFYNNVRKTLAFSKNFIAYFYEILHLIIIDGNADNTFIA